MASDPTLATRASDAVLHDLPTYRAISPLAVASAAFGLFSGLSFVSLWWIVLAALAVLTGLLADRRIRRYPDMLTGRSFAHAGMAMGLIFSMTSVSYYFWTHYELNREARAFALQITDEMNRANTKRPIETKDIIWFMIPPEYRKGISPEEAGPKMAQFLESSAKAQGMDESIRQMLRYAGEGKKIQLVKIEDAAFQDRDGYAAVLLKVGDGPHAKGHEDHDHDHAKAADPAKPESKDDRVAGIIGEGPDHARLVVHGQESGNKLRWYVYQLQYPYVPKDEKLVVPQKKANDDGHGHAH